MSILIVHVDVAVRPGSAGAFIEATRLNARASREEPGVLRFDVVQDQADADHFVLVEIYRDADAPAAHKKTAHYETWRQTVEPMMARPRTSVKFHAVDPASDAGFRA